jgi:hypothetical protein
MKGMLGRGIALIETSAIIVVVRSECLIWIRIQSMAMSMIIVCPIQAICPAVSRNFEGEDRGYAQNSTEWIR